MAKNQDTTNYALTDADYSQISQGESQGSLRHIKGGAILLIKAAAKPAVDAPFMSIFRPGQETPYFGYSDTVLLWGKAVSGNAELTASGAE
ncbi:hypothetical protein P7F88_19310 [Vibrio hannami]|uniref:hypothetical protein n=1 Tax=Vibrio hannami TaxID=2717094 RepID=UPI002410B615|nr:hypothetical protein [Vibrio hannami]MDG3088105.1 hypothetical protein [Vibrio hannami]